MFKRTCACVLLIVVSATECCSQQLPPPMPYSKRAALAKKLVKSDRAAALANPSSPDRVNVFTATYARIDPSWTAGFIINNPIKGGEEMGFEVTVVRRLLSKPVELTDDQVLGLIQSTKFMQAQFAGVALRHLPRDAQHDLLRQKIVKAVLPLEEEYTMPALGSWLDVARHSNDPKVFDRMRSKVDEFYRSGKVEEIWKQIQANQKSAGNRPSYAGTRLRRQAPKDFDLSFMGTPKSMANRYELYPYMHDDFVDTETLGDWLSTKTGYDFGSEFYEVQQDAVSLGTLAKTHPEVARQWAGAAPHPVVTVLAELCIAPAIAKQDRDAAIAMVRRSFKELLAIDVQAPANRGDLLLMNLPPTRVAAVGLRAANQIDKDLLAECVDQMLVLWERETQVDRQYNALVQVARFNREKARKVFDVLSEEVLTGYARSYLRVLVAIDPDQFWDEYQGFLEASEGDPDVQRDRILMEIAPALAEKETSAFWDMLEGSQWGSGAISIPADLFKE